MLTSYRQLSSLRNTPGQAPGRGALESPWPRSLTWMSGARCVGLLMVATLVATIVGRKRVGSGRAVFAHRVGGGGAVGVGGGGVRGSLIGGGGRHKSPGRGRHRSLREHHRRQQPHRRSRSPAGGWQGWWLSGRQPCRGEARQ